MFGWLALLARGDAVKDTEDRRRACGVLRANAGLVADVSARAGRVAAPHGGAGAFMRSLGGGRHPAGGEGRPADVLQELRVVGAGALSLLVFLLCVSFTSRFIGLSAVQRGMYLTSAALAAVAAVLLLVPAACPALVPRHRPGGQASRAVSAVAAGGLAAAGLAVSAAVRLAARWAGSGVAADLLGAGTAILLAAVWFGFPWLLTRGSGPPPGRPARTRRKGG